jgi:hypothetical protein
LGRRESFLLLYATNGENFTDIFVKYDNGLSGYPRQLSVEERGLPLPASAEECRAD